MLTEMVTFVFLASVGDFAFGWRKSDSPFMTTPNAGKKANLLFFARIKDAYKATALFPAMKTGEDLGYLLSVFD